ncbi:Uncharacterised protein [Escherichia coli]|uniref:Uncharacterized protein n=1 Tax=Escherichia coli TaxID=562 RepID=A0A377AIJ8_ECOLX|nr:Uncharacterised protein [Escherichia coli]
MPQNNAAGEIDNDVGLPCVTNKKVPTSDVKIAQKTRMPGRDLRTSENQATIIVGERNCSTVAGLRSIFRWLAKK